MGPLDWVKLSPLMLRTSGRPEIKVSIIDGPVTWIIPTSPDKTFGMSPERTESSAREPAASPACTEHSLPGCSPQGEAPLHPPFAPAAPCSSGPSASGARTLTETRKNILAEDW